MRNKKILAEATFDPKLKIYLFFNAAFVMAVTCVGIPLLLPWAIFGMLWATKYFESLACQLTETELIVRKGVWFRQEKTIPLEKITDMAMHEGPIQRAFGFCALKVETAGSSAPQGAADAGLVGIIDPEKFRDAVLDQRDALSASGGRAASRSSAPAGTEVAAGAASGNPDETLAVLGEIRDTLRRIEVRLADRE